MQAAPAADGSGGRRSNDDARARELKEQSSSDLYDTLRGWLAHASRKTRRQLQLKHIQAIERLVLSTKSGRTIELPGNAMLT